MSALQPILNRTVSAKVLLAMIAVVFLAFVGANSASAAVTEAPEITNAPENPNTTEATVRFDYAVGEGETSTAPTLYFYCRHFPTGTPPAPTLGWFSCYNTAGDPPYWTENRTLPNENRTFQVAARESADIATQGPIATYEWTQNVSVPALPPVLTKQPDDPDEIVNLGFEWEPGAGEEGKINLYQCRIDGDAWRECNDGEIRFPGNGEHTFEVRGGNQHGWGPGTDPATWTKSVPNPNPSLPLREAASENWNGVMQNEADPAGRSLGDINGDGLGDFGVPTKDGILGMFGDPNGSLDIIFGSKGTRGNRTLGTQMPDEGVRVEFPDGVGWPGVNTVAGAGDQNGDGIDDFIVELGGSFGVMPYTFVVVYGGFDVTSLPTCSSSSARCLDITSLDADEGYTITTLTSSERIGGTNVPERTTADFDGDGVQDLLISGGVNSGRYYVVKGKERSGTIALDSLPAGEKQTFVGLASAGMEITSMGDLDGDGKDDVLLRDDLGGGSCVVYGREISTGEFSVTTLDPDDGFKVYSPAVSGMMLAPIGDVNGNGTPDLAGTSYSGVPDEDQTVSIFDAPERGSDGYILVGEGSEEIASYEIERGEPNLSDLGTVQAMPLGDMNNDGVGDFLTSAKQAQADGFVSAGAMYVMFGQNPVPDAPLGLGRSLTPDHGIAFRGEHSDMVGTKYAPLGDLDGDEMTDFFVGARAGTFGESPGRYSVVHARSFMSKTSTGKAMGVGNTTASVGAGVTTNNRDVEVKFEYGTTDEYGSETPVEEIGASGSGESSSADLTGLTKNTTYHYRAVVTNDLGLTYYGDDKTFTTTNTDDPITDPCAADNTKPGCGGYDHCKAKPGDCQGGGAKLALISSPKTIKVKRGKKGSVAAIVVNAGGKSASGVKVCVKAPKTVKVKKCQTVGGLGSGATSTKTFKVAVKKKAKKGKKISLNFTASGSGLASKGAKATIAVR
ncbi:MAG TPA: hypothetical protein VMF31_14595 [Solirubrobacterales bacterium]|nr:hypothetical protein [Solirubrobacterales bacterium]